jgi:hypothetical protein
MKKISPETKFWEIFVSFGRFWVSFGWSFVEFLLFWGGGGAISYFYIFLTPEDPRC